MKQTSKVTIISSLAMLVLFGVTILSGAVLSSSLVSADDSVVDQINITVPVSCTMSGTGMNSHNAEIQNGTYTPNIGTTTLHAFCNDAEGFAIYAAGYTGNEIGATNSNKLVGTSASSNATIDTGLATSAGSPDVSNWAMKLTMAQDSGDTTTSPFTIDSAPNVSGGADASFSDYHVVPNEYTKVAHKNSMTDMTTSTGGVKLTTTYAAYISKTQPADTYSGQVKYTLVHPASAAAPLPGGKIGVNYNANGSTFSGGATTNKVVYASSPMYVGTIATISKSSNVASDGTQNGAYYTGEEVNTLEPITLTGADKIKVVLRYGLTADSSGVLIAEGNWDGNSDITGAYYDLYSNSDNLSGTNTYVFDGDTITVAMWGWDTPVSGYDYGYYAQIYPVYTTEQPGTEVSSDLVTITTDTGTYANTTNWYGSWYADINNTHYDFMNEVEVTDFLGDNVATLGGTTVELYRGLTFTEAYTRASKSQDGGYYKQQELTKSMCNTIAITQNQTLKDVRDSNTYLVGKLKDGNCWMLDNLALDPTDSTTAANMNSSNTNATQEAITNLLNGGSTNTGWSSTAVADVDTGFNSYTAPMINNASKDTVVTSYGAGSGKVGIYYNYCAASASTYCYAGNSGVDVPDTIIDAPQDICPANWRMPTGGSNGEYLALYNKYNTTQDATSSASLQYNLSNPLSGYYNSSSASNQGNWGRWWSSTYYGGYYMYRLDVNPTLVDPDYSLNRYFGITMRCLVGS